MAQGDILIADDDTTFTNFFCYDCEKHDVGLAVRIAGSGQEAIDAIEAEAPRVLVLDLRMPGKDGFAVLDHLAEKGLKVPVVVLTNYDVDEYRARCEKYGVQKYYVKSRTRVRQILQEISYLFAS